MEPITTETLFGGLIRMMQYQTGYRHSIDPVLLAHYVLPTPGQTMVDLGTGSGIIPIILSHRHPAMSLWGVEIQDRLVALARRNVRENGLDHTVTIIHGDLTRPEALPLPGPMDWVLSNPPYTPVKAGRRNPLDEKAIARHELLMTLDQLVRTAEILLKDQGRFAVIYPVQRKDELLSRLGDAGLTPRTLRMVHPLAHGPAKRVLIEAVKGGKPGLSILPPLVICDTPTHYSNEVKMMFC